MPGYCVKGTVGHKVLSGMKKIEIDRKLVRERKRKEGMLLIIYLIIYQQINIRISVQYMSFRFVE